MTSLAASYHRHDAVVGERGLQLLPQVERHKLATLQGSVHVHVGPLLGQSYRTPPTVVVDQLRLVDQLVDRDLAHLFSLLTYQFTDRCMRASSDEL